MTTFTHVTQVNLDQAAVFDNSKDYDIGDTFAWLVPTGTFITIAPQSLTLTPGETVLLQAQAAISAGVLDTTKILLTKYVGLSNPTSDAAAPFEITKTDYAVDEQFLFTATTEITLGDTNVIPVGVTANFALIAAQAAPFNDPLQPADYLLWKLVGVPATSGDQLRYIFGSSVEFTVGSIGKGVLQKIIPIANVTATIKGLSPSALVILDVSNTPVAVPIDAFDGTVVDQTYLFELGKEYWAFSDGISITLQEIKASNALIPDLIRMQRVLIANQGTVSSGTYFDISEPGSWKEDLIGNAIPNDGAESFTPQSGIWKLTAYLDQSDATDFMAATWQVGNVDVGSGGRSSHSSSSITPTPAIYYLSTNGTKVVKLISRDSGAPRINGFKFTMEQLQGSVLLEGEFVDKNDIILTTEEPVLLFDGFGNAGATADRTLIAPHTWATVKAQFRTIEQVKNTGTSSEQVEHATDGMVNNAQFITNGYSTGSSGYWGISQIALNNDGNAFRMENTVGGTNGSIKIYGIPKQYKVNEAAGGIALNVAYKPQNRAAIDGKEVWRIDFEAPGPAAGAVIAVAQIGSDWNRIVAYSVGEKDGAGTFRPAQWFINAIGWRWDINPAGAVRITEDGNISNGGSAIGFIEWTNNT